MHNREDRAKGALLGQLCGDALGSLVEFHSERQIRQRYPEGLRDMADGGTWNTIAGQPTDDSEMALLLARYLAQTADYRADEMLDRYRYWLNSNPFDCGNTIYAALTGYKNEQSQANGALMRISPLGIFGAYIDLDKVAEFAMSDAQLTHIHPVCVKSNALYAMAIAYAVRGECKIAKLYELMLDWSRDLKAPQEIRDCLGRASEKKPEDFMTHAGWVLIALQNAVYHLIHTTDPEEAIVESVASGGDTDTNAAICGALCGAVHGMSNLPERWLQTLRNCKPSINDKRVRRPRPEVFWPNDAEKLALDTLKAGKNNKYCDAPVI